LFDLILCRGNPHFDKRFVFDLFAFVTETQVFIQLKKMNSIPPAIFSRWMPRGEPYTLETSEERRMVQTMLEAKPFTEWFFDELSLSDQQRRFTRIAYLYAITKHYANTKQRIGIVTSAVYIVADQLIQQCVELNVACENVACENTEGHHISLTLNKQCDVWIADYPWYLSGRTFDILIADFVDRNMLHDVWPLLKKHEPRPRIFVCVFDDDGKIGDELAWAGVERMPTDRVLEQQKQAFDVLYNELRLPEEIATLMCFKIA
jgi:hypothetical protein